MADILVVSQRFWPEDQKINDIVQGFLDRGHKVDVLCGKPNYPAGEFYKGYSTFSPKKEILTNGTIYRAAEIKRSSGSPIRKFLNYASFPMAAALKAGRLKKNHYDAVLVYQTSPLTMAGAAFKVAKHRKIPVTIYAIDIWPDSIIEELDIHSPLLKSRIRATANKYYNGADRIVAAGDMAESFFLKQMDMPRFKVAEIPLCPDERLLQEIRSPLIMERYQGSFNIVYTGRLDEDKDIETVIRAAQFLNNKGLRDIRFIIVGTGENLDSIRQDIWKKGLNDMFFIEDLTRPDEISKFTFIADALLAITLPEEDSSLKFNTEVIDYMAAGRPIISLMGSAEKRLISRAGCGFAAETGNPEELAEVILKLYRMETEKLEEYGRNARKYQMEHFNRDECIDRLLDVMLGKDIPKEGEESSVFIMED